MALYHWTGRIKQAQTINGGTVTTVDYEYDTEGNRFIKRTDLGGIVTEIHDLSSDYRIYADGSSEVHTIEIRNGNDPVARFRFQDNHHNSGVWAPSSLFGHRLGADLLRIASLEGGITKLPSLLGFAFSDAYYAVKLLPQIQNKARLLVLLYWTLASLIALAALVLLVRAWRRNPDEGPGLLPVGVYRFGSVLALLSFSATGCIVVPQTQDGSEYLLAANGLFRGTSEGGESNIMSVLGAFYYVSTHNGSTDIVTNADGAPVARFVYEPFGKVNSDLTDLDPDRNGVHYGEQFQFTGQEYEPETGLYNYKARIYDPETGRFLQPDPVHTDQPGQDNWDRYQYVWNNPVNFVDPDGEKPKIANGFGLGAGCGTGSRGALIYQNYVGPGSCAEPAPKLERVILLLLLIMSEDTPAILKAVFTLVLYDLYKGTKSPASHVDAVGKRHDTYGANFLSSDSRRANIIAARDFASVWSTSTYGDVYKRECGAINCDKGGTLRRYQAEVNTYFAYMYELIMGTIGAILMGVTAQIQAVATVRRGRYHNDRFDIKPNRDNFSHVRISGPEGRIMSFSMGTRSKNLFKPSKWKL